MRPQRTQQNPTPFARKWPRQRRRAEKGPSEVVKTLSIYGNKVERHGLGFRVYGLTPHDAAMELQVLLKAHCPKGWVMADVKKTHNSLTNITTAAATYRRPKKEKQL